MFISRRQFLGRAGTGLLLAESRLLQAQRTSAMSPLAPSAPVPSQSKVAVIHGEARRKIVHDALAAIDEQIKPKLAGKKYVVIKPNGLAAENPLASTHPDDSARDSRLPDAAFQRAGVDRGVVLRGHVRGF